MNIYLTYPTFVHLQNELDLIEQLARFEGFGVYRVYAHDKLFNYYKGGRPVVLIKNGPDSYHVIYGIWGFIEHLQTNVLRRC